MKNFQKIAKSVLFQNFHENDIKSILKCLGAVCKSYLKDEAVFIAGDPLLDVGLVLSGGLRVEKDDITGKSVLVEEIGAGETFGTAIVCSGAGRIQMGVWSTGDSEVLFIDYSKIMNICPSACSFHKKLIRNILKDMADRLIRLTGKISIIQKTTTREKLIEYFSDSGAAYSPVIVNKTRLSEYIGVNRSAMSRELSKMKDAGIVSFVNSGIMLNKL